MHWPASSCCWMFAGTVLVHSLFTETWASRLKWIKPKPLTDWCLCAKQLLKDQDRRASTESKRKPKEAGGCLCWYHVHRPKSWTTGHNAIPQPQRRPGERIHHYEASVKTALFIAISANIYGIPWYLLVSCCPSLNKPWSPRFYLIGTSALDPYWDPKAEASLSISKEHCFYKRLSSYWGTKADSNCLSSSRPLAVSYFGGDYADSDLYKSSGWETQPGHGHG